MLDGRPWRRKQSQGGLFFHQDSEGDSGLSPLSLLTHQDFDLDPLRLSPRPLQCPVTPERQGSHCSHLRKTPRTSPLGLSSAEATLVEQEQDDKFTLVKRPPSPPQTSGSIVSESHPSTQSLGVPSKPSSTMYETRCPGRVVSILSAKETYTSKEAEKAKLVDMLRDLEPFESSPVLTSSQHSGPPTGNANIQHGSSALLRPQVRSKSKVEQVSAAKRPQRERPESIYREGKVFIKAKEAHPAITTKDTQARSSNSGEESLPDLPASGRPLSTKTCRPVNTRALGTSGDVSETCESGTAAKGMPLQAPRSPSTSLIVNGMASAQRYPTVSSHPQEENNAQSPGSCYPIYLSEADDERTASTDVSQLDSSWAAESETAEQRHCARQAHEREVKSSSIGLSKDSHLDGAMSSEPIQSALVSQLSAQEHLPLPSSPPSVQPSPNLKPDPSSALSDNQSVPSPPQPQPTHPQHPLDTTRISLPSKEGPKLNPRGMTNEVISTRILRLWRIKLARCRYAGPVEKYWVGGEGVATCPSAHPLPVTSDIVGGPGGLEREKGAKDVQEVPDEETWIQQSAVTFNTQRFGEADESARSAQVRLWLGSVDFDEARRWYRLCERGWQG